jgi:hypothetical protein
MSRGPGEPEDIMIGQSGQTILLEEGIFKLRLRGEARAGMGSRPDRVARGRVELREIRMRGERSPQV